MAESPKNLVETRHPEYTANAEKWERHRASFRGGREYALNCMIRHQYEEEASFKDRQARAFGVGYCGTVISQRIGYIVKTPPQIEGVNATLDAWLSRENIDLCEGGITQIVRQIATVSAVYGTALIAVDVPNIGRELLSRADAEDSGVAPYWMILSPLSLLNFGLDDHGDMEWALLRQPINRQVLAVDSPTLVNINLPPYLLWRRDRWERLGEKGGIIETGLNPLGIVPIAMCRFQRDENQFFGLSLLEDIEPVNREINRQWSLLSELLCRQTFSQLVAQDRLEATPQYDSTGKPMRGVVRLASDAVLYYPMGANAPQFISPDALQPGMILAVIQELTREVYRLAALKRGAARETGQVESGIAKAFDFLDTNQALADHAESISDAMEKALWLTWQYYSPGDRSLDSTIRVVFPGDFGVDTADDLLRQYLMLDPGASNIPPALLAAFMEKSVAPALLAHLSENQREAIMREVRSWYEGIREIEAARGEIAEEPEKPEESPIEMPIMNEPE